MSACSRLGDHSDHGGTIISASSNLLANGIGVAREGDLHDCPIHGHGVTSLTAIATNVFNGQLLITVGSTAGCGATIIEGSPSVGAD